jgi:hypothetical protein
MSINTNHWRTLEYYDPASILHKLRALEHEMADVLRDADADVRALRTPELNSFREWRDAALFTYGMGVAMGVKVGYATGATSDYDFVTAWVRDTTAFFCPVQLKELVPEDRNPEDTIGGLLWGLRKYGATSTVLAIKLSRKERVNLDREWARIPFAQLWFFWASKPDASEWSIYGDALGTPRQWAFDYPTFSGRPSWVG